MDSSALVKLYAEEADHDVVRSLEAVAACALARVEVPAAFWRKQRLGELSAADAATLTQAFEADYQGSDGRVPRFAVVAATPAILSAAARLVAAHPLRACDSVQLASALAARSADPGCDAFACFDAGLRTAAAANGFTLIP